MQLTSNWIKIFRNIRGIMLFSFAVCKRGFFKFFSKKSARSVSNAQEGSQAAVSNSFFVLGKNEPQASEKKVSLNKTAMYNSNDLVSKYKAIDELVELGLLY